MNNYKRRHQMLGYLFSFYKSKYDSTTSREFPPEDYRISIATFNEKMGIKDYRDDAILDPLLRNAEITPSNDGHTTYYHIPEAGRLAYLNKRYLKELSLHRQEWPKRNWVLVALITYLLGLFTPSMQHFIENQISHKSISIDTLKHSNGDSVKGK